MGFWIRLERPDTAWGSTYWHRIIEFRDLTNQKKSSNAIGAHGVAPEEWQFSECQDDEAGLYQGELGRRPVVLNEYHYGMNL